MFFAVFIFGLIIGSFLNAAIFRLHSGEGIVSGRSKCVHCGHVLEARDLVPVLSFIFLRGRCRYCKARISWQYPIVELITSIAFILLASNYELRITNYEFWIQAFFICTFIIIAVYDYKHYLILDKVVFPSLGFAFVFAAVSGQQPIVNSLLGALAIAGLQYLLSKGRWIGLGDVKFGLLFGAVLGLKLSVAGLFLAYFIGALAGMALLALNRKKLSDKLPFGVFLSTAAIVVLLYGEKILAWYENLTGL